MHPALDFPFTSTPSFSRTALARGCAHARPTLRQRVIRKMPPPEAISVNDFEPGGIENRWGKRGNQPTYNTSHRFVLWGNLPCTSRLIGPRVERASNGPRLQYQPRRADSDGIIHYRGRDLCTADIHAQSVSSHMSLAKHRTIKCTAAQNTRDYSIHPIGYCRNPGNALE